MGDEANVVSIRAVAAHAGVSAATVSRVINGRGYVSDAARARVEQAIAALNFRPNIHAQRLRGVDSRMIALVFAQVSHPFSVEVAAAIDEIALQHGYFVIVGNTHKNVALFERYVATFIAYGVDGLIIVPPVISKSVTTSLRTIPLPYVLIDQRIPELAVDQVVTDNAAGAYRLTCHLLDHGCRRIAFVGGNPKTPKGQARLAGYERALGEQGIPVDPALVRMREFDEQSGYELTIEVLREASPEALFAANMDVQLGMLRAIHELGLSVPEDIMLSGFDDLPYAAQFSPVSAVVAQQTRTIGVIAAQLLLDKLQGKRQLSESQVVLLQPQLIVRPTSASVRREGVRG